MESLDKKELEKKLDDKIEFFTTTVNSFEKMFNDIISIRKDIIKIIDTMEANKMISDVDKINALKIKLNKYG